MIYVVFNAETGVEYDRFTEEGQASAWCDLLNGQLDYDQFKYREEEA